MAITIEDVQKAIETIETFCKEFEADYPKRMEPLTGADITRLSNTRNTVSSIATHLNIIKGSFNASSFK